MAGATRTAYSNRSQAPARVAGRSGYPVAGAAVRHPLVASMPYWNFPQYPAGLAAAVAQPAAGIMALVRRHDYAGAGTGYANLRASHQRQPRLLPPGVCFPFMRMLDAAISLYSVPAAWLSVSSGRWKSPARRPVGRAATALLPAAAGGPAASPYRTGTSDEPGGPARVAEASHVSG
jgi:hypothetical protein